MAVTTFIAAYTFSLLGDVCQAGEFGTSCAFEKVWTSTLGAGSAWLPQASIGCLTFCICSVYLICLGELLPPLLTLFGVPARLRSRRASVLLAAAATFPLCLRRSLAGLEFSSYLGVAAILYTAAFSLMRWIDGTYSESAHSTIACQYTCGRAFQTPRHRWRPVEGSPQPPSSLPLCIVRTQRAVLLSHAQGREPDSASSHTARLASSYSYRI